MLTQKTLTLLIDVSENTTVGTVSFYGMRGYLRKAQIVSPALDGADTYTFAIADEHSQTMFSLATIAESITKTIPVAGDVALTQAWFTNAVFFQEDPTQPAGTITITASGVQTADRTFTIRLWFEETGLFVA